MISFSFLLFFVFFFISQYTCIGGGSWFEGKRSLEKRSKQCGPWQGSSCFKKLKRPVFFYDDNETSDDLFLEKRNIQCGIRWHGQSNCGFKRLRRSLYNLSNEQLEALERFLLPENTSVSDRQLENFDFSDDVPEKKRMEKYKKFDEKTLLENLEKQNKLKNITLSHLYVRPYNHQ